MKAIHLNKAGGIEELQYVEVPQPVIKPTEVLVAVKAISINPVDVKARAYEGVKQWIFGGQSPVVLGWDIAGTVVEVGDEVTALKVGDEVFGMVNFFGQGNAYAEYVAVPATHLSLLPHGVTHTEGAAIAMVGSTAYQALVDVAKVKQGDKVLVHAASGGVGHVAVQIAKAFGAHVIGTSSAKNKDFVLAIGADEHLDYTTRVLRETISDVDIVIDTIQGNTLLESVAVVRPGGVIVTLPSPEISEEALVLAKDKGVTIAFMMVESKQETINALAQLMAKEVVKPIIAQVFVFDEMGQAHLAVETNRTVGKVVVVL
ncbi:MAG: NADP-dependent oxidoreductase [Flavobacteriaceae bacterium]|jgi:NADPH:quinone reductase-like Zn-dependent oxidoreductase|nr:NADP-dependent oxidoreductase [Flavobacteriaceae bacterium]